MGRKLSPKAQKFREKLHRARHGRWWWVYYYRLPQKLPWALVVTLTALLVWCCLKSL